MLDLASQSQEFAAEPAHKICLPLPGKLGLHDSAKINLNNDNDNNLESMTNQRNIRQGHDFLIFVFFMKTLS